MKTIISIVTITIMTATAFTAKKHETDSPTTVEGLGIRVVEALRRQSPEEYARLYPSLEEFHHLMDENAHFYGSLLSDAKEDFSNEYRKRLIPSVKRSFAQVLAQGARENINWNNIRFVRAEDDSTNGSRMTIVFSSEEKIHRVKLDKVVFLDPGVRATQFISWEK